MNSLTTILRSGLAASAFITAATALQAQAGTDEVQQLREQIRALDQKLRVLESKTEIKDEETATAAKAAAKLTATDKGFTIASGDGANTLRLRALIQADARAFFNDDPALTNNNTFLLRRARLIFEGTFNKNVSFLLVPEFAGGSPSIVDAYVNYALKPSLQFRIGRFREPVGLEQLQSDAVAFFTERSIVSQLLPNRDLGVQVGGDLRNGTLSYAVGIFNGVPDGSNNGAVSGTTVNADSDNAKDVAGRVFAQPFKNNADSALKGLGFGVGASYGREKPASGLASYRTDAQQTAFAYRTTTIIDGKTTRISPQANFYSGPLGLQAEYALSTINARPGANLPKVEATNKAWQFSAGYVLTGEDSGYTGVVPKTNFDLAAGTWGAFEVVGRYDQLSLDDAVFAPNPTAALSLADPAANPSDIKTFGLGLNWYLTKTLRATFNYFHTEFSNNVETPTRPVLRKDENALITRVQVSF
jgi:phosphate-selective porin OprO and OprP